VDVHSPMLVLTISDNPLRIIFNANSMFFLALLWTVILDRFFDVVKSHGLLTTEIQTSDTVSYFLYMRSNLFHQIKEL
jgi:hypothetical protein